jgi:ferrochelatase
MDPYVIDAPWPVRRLLVSCFILPFRPRTSAAAYREIWEPDLHPEAPLVRHGRALAQDLTKTINHPVALGMRYGSPRLEGAIEALLDAGVEEVFVVALYPQHADSTRTTIVEQVKAFVAHHDADVNVRVLPPFYDQPRYLDVLAQHTQRHLPADLQLLLCSYHGLPERQVTGRDPTGTHCLASADCCERPSPAHASCYRHHALATTEGLRTRLDLGSAAIETSFQSRLGRLPWLAPYTDEVLAALPTRGITRLAVTAPAFVADNLETLEELGIRGRQQFLDAGGESFTLLPCLNEDPDWVRLLADWANDPLPESAIDG